LSPRCPTITPKGQRSAHSCGEERGSALTSKGRLRWRPSRLEPAKLANGARFDTIRRRDDWRGGIGPLPHIRERFSQAPPEHPASLASGPP
jgi:hypothetical protein